MLTIEFPGIGLTAKSAEAGGISLIIIYNRYLTMSHDASDSPCMY
jgi:predicted TIM-barrel enzyme